MVDYVQPKANGDAYHCPYCHSFSDQFWVDLVEFNGHTQRSNPSYHTGYCRRCKNITIWHDEKMIYPLTGNAPDPNSDLPNNIKIDYEEAREIVSRSPRSACVLLRLCVEKICDEQNALGVLLT